MMTSESPRSNQRSKMSPLAWVLLLSALFFVVFVMITGGVYLYRSPGGGKGGHGARGFLAGGGNVGIVELNGVIMDSKKTLKKLELLEDDDSVKAIVLRLNSPGGAVAPTQEI